MYSRLSGPRRVGPREALLTDMERLRMRAWSTSAYLSPRVKLPMAGVRSGVWTVPGLSEPDDIHDGVESALDGQDDVESEDVRMPGGVDGACGGTSCTPATCASRQICW